MLLVIFNDCTWNYLVISITIKYLAWIWEVNWFVLRNLKIHRFIELIWCLEWKTNIANKYFFQPWNQIFFLKNYWWRSTNVDNKASILSHNFKLFKAKVVLLFSVGKQLILYGVMVVLSLASNIIIAKHMLQSIQVSVLSAERFIDI